MSNVFYAPYPSASPFYFDIEYNNINRDELQEKASNDGVFVGRFILTRYTNEPTNDMHEVVWQKVFEDNALSYKEIARIGMDGAIEQLQTQWDEVYGELTQEKINAQNSAADALEAKNAALEAQGRAETAQSAASQCAEAALEAQGKAENAQSAAARFAGEAQASQTAAETSANNAATSANNALAREQEIDAMLASKELTIFWNDYL